jgi:hypothetical protein
LTAKVPKRSLKSAIEHDDGQDDPDNPIVAFRMSDRLLLYGNELKVNIILWVVVFVAAAVGAGMAMKFL